MTKEKYIAYVEDDPEDVLLLQEAFEGIEGADVRPFEDGSALLLFLKAVTDGRYPCLIVLDQTTYGMTALETVAQLRESPAFSAIPVAILTAEASPRNKHTYEQEGIALFIKPDYVEGWQALGKNFSAYCD